MAVCNLVCAQVFDMRVTVLTCGCFRVCFFQPFFLQSLSLASLWSRISATSCTKASGSIVPLPGRSAAAAQEGAGSTRCGTGPPARPAAPGGPAPDVLGAGLETPGSSSLATSGRWRRWEAGTINKVNKNVKSTEKAGEGCPQNQKSALQLAPSMVLQL